MSDNGRRTKVPAVTCERELVMRRVRSGGPGKGGRRRQERARIGPATSLEVPEMPRATDQTALAFPVALRVESFVCAFIPKAARLLFRKDLSNLLVSTGLDRVVPKQANAVFTIRDVMNLPAYRGGLLTTVERRGLGCVCVLPRVFCCQI